MLNQRSMLVNILLIVGFFLVAGALLSIVLGIIGSLLWFAIKFLIPIAIIVWLVRVIFGNNQQNPHYR
ncbi:hypothetical protein ACSFB8_11735 [Enterococcus faecalis]